MAIQVQLSKLYESLRQEGATIKIGRGRGGHITTESVQKLNKVIGRTEERGDSGCDNGNPGQRPQQEKQKQEIPKRKKKILDSLSQSNIKHALFSNEHCNLASSSSRSCFLRRAAANSGSASAALPVFSSSISATSDLQSGEDSIIGDSPDEDAVIVGTDDATNSVGDGEQPNFSGEGETESCLIIIMGVVGVDGV